jgi:hypothetical protein
VKVAGRWRYVYRPFDQLGQIIDVLALLGCVDPGQSEANIRWDQITKTSSSNATVTRRLVGSSTASS